jgi:hypothetical protein
MVTVPPSHVRAKEFPMTMDDSPLEPDDTAADATLSGATAYPEDSTQASEAMQMGMALGMDTNTAGAGHLENTGDTSFTEPAVLPGDVAAPSRGEGGLDAPAVTPEAPPGSPITIGPPDPSHALPAEAKLAPDANRVD